MQKFFRYILPALIGLGLGLVILWLLGSSQGTKSESVTASSSSLLTPTLFASPAVTATPTSAPSVVPPSPPPPPSGVGAEYLVLGDSIAYGIGAPTPTDQGYAGLFYTNYLKRIQPNLTMYRNLAVPGETSASFITSNKTKSQLQSALEDLDAAAKDGRRVSPIILTLGGNDMLGARGKSQAERESALSSFDYNFSYILDQLKANAPQSDLIVTNYYNPYATSTGDEDAETAWVRRFNATIQQRATERGLKVADFFDAIRGQEQTLTWIGVGDVHPTSSGHTALAQVLWKASGYDTKPPVLSITYSPLLSNGKITSGGRLVFKLSVQDEWSLRVPADDPTPGAGVVLAMTATLDDTPKKTLPATPSRYSAAPAGVQQYSYIIDTTLLVAGQHRLHFEASDAAGNVGAVDVPFEIAP
jgi:lysophospholipase L1-like esterase